MERLRSRLPAFSLSTLQSVGGSRITWSDVAITGLATALTQIWLAQRADLWGHSSLVFVGAVAVSPLIVAIRRLNPGPALVGLLLAGYLWSFLFDQAAWPLLIACLLVVSSLPTRSGKITGLVLTIALAGLPPISHWLAWLPGSLEVAWSYVQRVGWPGQLAAALAVWAVVSLILRRRRQGRRSAIERAEELLVGAFSRTDPLLVDLLVGLGLSSVVLIEIWSGKAHGNWWTAPGWMPYVLVCAPLTLAVRRRRPAIPAVILGIAALLSYWQTGNLGSMLFALGFALYSLGTGRPALRWSVPTAVLLLAALPMLADRIRYPQMVLIFPRIDHPELDSNPERALLQGWEVYSHLVDRQWPVSLSLTLLMPVCAGIAVRLYARNRQAAAREAELERVATEREAEQVVLTERSYIARDLHDVVAHAVNLMVIQAETGPDLIRRGDADVLAGFQRIGDAGRRALSELDRLLSALRDEDGIPDPQLAPQPGLGDLPQLVTDVSDGHLPIELDVAGDPDGPPEGQQLAAYRLVQEALTNVVRHAKASAARVVVRVEETGVRVVVTDDGSGFDVAAAARGGRHGLAGMRERVRIEGGTLEIRSTPGAGTTIAAWFPVGAGR
ncbi:sensor histidine kinase [Kribbella sp. NPDC026611]|uniref:sensor histidine kinase n=1 Tax=Kribbella sp. NPDC026611 TaxID=3154911 RepID=UPI0033FD0F96